MLKLLDRTKSHKTDRSKAAKLSEETLPFHPASCQPRPSLQLPRSDAFARRQDVKTARPQTADDGRHSKMARMSFFEAFAIDAGDDTFAFPKPSSAKTTPKEMERLASFVSSREVSPMIGVAFGSPSHPPQCWTRHPSFGPGSANATPRTPRFTETFNADSMPLPRSPRSPRPTITPAWKKVGNLFRRATKSSKPDHTVRHQADKVDTITQQPSVSTKGSRPKSRGRMTLTKDKRLMEPLTKWPMDSKVDLRSNHVLRATDIRVSTETAPQHTQSPRPSKISRVLGADPATLQIEVPTIYDRPIPLRTQSTPAPRLELQVPSYQLERYSVMFEKVLDPKPSLIERRKSRLRLVDADTEEAVTHLAPLSAITTDGKKPLIRSATSPSLSPSLIARREAYIPDRQSKQMAFHKPLPPLQRSNTTPLLRISPLREEYNVPFTYHPLQPAFFDSPISASEDEPPFPHTPPLSGDSEHTVHVVTDTPLGLASPNVWHSVLPAPPGSSTSSRFSVDVHKALDSPRLLSRSRSYHGKDSTPRPVVRQVQVAVARKVSMSQLINTADLGASTSMKPKMIHVGSQAHSRKTSVLDTYDG